MKFTKRTHLEIHKRLYANALSEIGRVALQKANPFMQRLFGISFQSNSKRFKGIGEKIYFFFRECALALPDPFYRSRLVQPGPAFLEKNYFICVSSVHICG